MSYQTFSRRHLPHSFPHNSNSLTAFKLLVVVVVVVVVVAAVAVVAVVFTTLLSTFYNVPTRMLPPLVPGRLRQRSGIL